MQIRLADIVGKTIVTCYVPADRKAVTFVLEEGRMSLGAPLVQLSGPGDVEGAKVTGLTRTLPDAIPRGWRFDTDKGAIIVEYEGAEWMSELPE